jgi:FkbM family methyltransferase
MKKVLKSVVSRLGYKIEKIQPMMITDPAIGDSMYNGLFRLRSIGLDPATIIDVGAAEGVWTEKAATVWKEADFLLFEPLKERKEQLTNLQSRSKNRIFLAFAAAGKEESEVTFHVSEDLDGSGIATDSKSVENARTVKLTSIDTQVKVDSLAPPFAIKLDTHGFEVPILSGAEETLKNTLFIIVECYGFYIAPGSLLFWEMCQFMNSKGFRLFDLVDTMRRPGDKAFWQCDAIFIKADNPLFRNTSYK